MRIFFLSVPRCRQQPVDIAASRTRSVQDQLAILPEPVGAHIGLLAQPLLDATGTGVQQRRPLQRSARLRDTNESVVLCGAIDKRAVLVARDL
jgi:hypothetical protein